MARLILLRKSAPARELYPQAGEEVSAHHLAFGHAGLRTIAHCNLLRGERHIRHHLHRRRLPAQRIVDRIRERLIRIDRSRSARRVGGSQVENPRRIGHRKRLEQHCIHHAEDRGIGANAKRQRKHADQREPWPLLELAERVAQIVKQCGHSCLRADRESVAVIHARAGPLPRLCPGSK